MNSDFSNFTGIAWGISYRQIPQFWNDADCQRYCARLKEKFAVNTKAWTDDLHSEWMTRNYLALKMILSASIMLTSFRFCSEKNIRIVEPYLLYYASLSCCRAVILTSPDHDFNKPDFHEM